MGGLSYVGIMIAIAFVSVVSFGVKGDLNLGTSVMRQMWMTPVQIYSLNNEANEESVPVLNNTYLSNTKIGIMHHYGQFEKTNTVHDVDATKSDAYFSFQQKNDLQYKICKTEGLLTAKATECVSSNPKAFHDLAPIFQQSVVNYLKECYIDSIIDTIKVQDPLTSMSIWASVHANGSYHSAHHHKDSLISGILYITTPPNAGPIVFQDPRGSLPPFGKSLQIVPKSGDLILFPSWLVHTVLPTLNANPRISISFNYNGHWEITSDINQAFIV